MFTEMLNELKNLRFSDEALYMLLSIEEMIKKEREMRQQMYNNLYNVFKHISKLDQEVYIYTDLFAPYSFSFNCYNDKQRFYSLSGIILFNQNAKDWTSHT